MNEKLMSKFLSVQFSQDVLETLKDESTHDLSIKLFMVSKCRNIYYDARVLAGLYLRLSRECSHVSLSASEMVQIIVTIRDLKILFQDNLWSSEIVNCAFKQFLENNPGLIEDSIGLIDQYKCGTISAEQLIHDSLSALFDSDNEIIKHLVPLLRLVAKSGGFYLVVGLGIFRLL